MRVGDMEDLTDYELVYGSEGVGSKGKSGVRIYVLRYPETRAAHEALDNDRKKHGGHLTPREEENGHYRRVGSEVERLLEEQTLRLDPKSHEGKLKTRADFEKAFADAGLGPIFMEELPNKYQGEKDPYSKYDPWYVVTTPIGHIEIGWRKRVINIDWTRTVLRSLRDDKYGEGPRVPRGDELFPKIAEENYPTLGDHHVHAYGYEKATEYLKVLAEWPSVAHRPKQKPPTEIPAKSDQP